MVQRVLPLVPRPFGAAGYVVGLVQGIPAIFGHIRWRFQLYIDIHTYVQQAVTGDLGNDSNRNAKHAVAGVGTLVF